jgi:hypothetical protein
MLTGNTATFRPNTFTLPRTVGDYFPLVTGIPDDRFSLMFVFPVLICGTCQAELTHAQSLSTHTHMNTNNDTHTS